jgi:thiamine monophosphate kinase
VVEKALIHRAFQPAAGVAGDIQLGDDCAAIPNPSGPGYLLFAAEGMLESFVRDDPWFAGYSAVMVNLSDVAAMGGRPLAIADVLWTPSEAISDSIWAGMRAASEAYGVPIVGGHTTRIGSGNAALAAAVLGHAGERLITSFDARPGDHLVIAIDMTGSLSRRKTVLERQHGNSSPNDCARISRCCLHSRRKGSAALEKISATVESSALWRCCPTARKPVPCWTWIGFPGQTACLGSAGWFRFRVMAICWPSRRTIWKR